MKEKLLESKLRNQVKKRGGLAVKFSSQTLTGLPDRFILMPGGRILFAEVKTTSKKPTPLQALQLRNLRLLGFEVFIIDCQDKLDDLLTSMDREV